MIQGPYHVISIGLLLVFFYLLSLLGVRLKVLTLADHRKFWNTLLLIFFFSAALLGLFLALRVNYRWDIPWIDRALQWHVDLGIGLAFVAFFHFLWNFGFYRHLFRRKKHVSLHHEFVPHLVLGSRQVIMLFILLGFISMIAQLVLLREFIKTFHGNELIIGIFLAIWMILTSLGARAGSVYGARIYKGTLFRLVLFLSLVPLIIYLMLIMITRVLFLPGYEQGMFTSSCYIIFLLILFTLISGFLFSYFSRSIAHQQVSAGFYMLESLGSLAGGVVFGLILIFLFDNVQVLTFLFLFTVIMIITIFGYPSGILKRVALVISGILIFGSMLIPRFQHAVEGLRYRGEKLIDSRDTPYGNLSFTTREGQVTGYLDRFPVLQSYDLARAEETVHYPALQHPDPDSFLMIGGGLSGNAPEVNKYDPEVFDYCDINPWIYQLGRKHLPPERTGSFKFINMDGRSWLLHEGSDRYDVIIADVGDPLTLGWNRYYTLEFFQLVKSHLSPGGVYGMQLSAGGSYVNVEGSEILSSCYQTLQKVFSHVTVVPGYATYFLASEDSLSLDFPALLKDRSISTTYVHPDYMDPVHLAFDRDQLLERFHAQEETINRDLWPRLFFMSISGWISRTGGTLGIAAIISILVFIVLLFSYPPLKAGMYMAGFTGAGIQIILIMVNQALYGFAYLVAPIMITLFMAGLVAGTASWKSIWHQASTSNYTGLLWILAILAAVAVVLLRMDQLFANRILGQLLLGVMNFLPGVMVGSIYGISLALSDREGFSGIGKVYSADLAGAALGTFIPPIFILPLLGVSNTFILFFGMNVATGLYILVRRRKR
ncbi:MAG: fused MFS/spermidine synthase [Bacteroidales bacterium]